MSNKIKPKRSYTANAVPTIADLEAHELAINWADGKAYTKDASGQIVSLTMGGGGGSSVDSRWDLFLPPAPTGLAATAASGEVSLTWTAPAVLSQTPITDYVIQYSANGGTTYSTFSDGTSTATSATVTGLTNGTEYVFRVAAITGIGQGAYSATVAATPAAVIDQNFSQVSLLLRGQGGQVVDESPRTKTFTLGGSVAFSSAQSRFGGGSAYLPGAASDKITVPSTADFAFGTGDFTVEFFYYYTPVNAGEYRLTSFGGPANQFANLASGWQGYGLSLVNESVSHFLPVGSGPTANQWDHIAYERYNGTFYLYLNGALLGTAYANINTPTTGLEIYGQGYIDQFRVTKSVARYQGATFTPPTAAFPDAGPAE